MLKKTGERSYQPVSSSEGPSGIVLTHHHVAACEISHDLGDYEVVEDIGRGQFGVVQKICLKKQRERILVWKKIKYSEMEDAEKRQLAQEVQLLQALSHTNVVRYIGKINDKTTAVLYLIMEFCDGGDLARYLGHTVKKGHFLPEELILSWFRQLVDALYYCHTRPAGKVLHRDLKPQNILLSGKYKKLKLADFGLAKMLQPSQRMAQTHVGTPYYMSPEVLSRCQYDEKSDIWSLGCLIYEMSTGLSPFSRASSYEDLCQRVDQGITHTNDFPAIYVPELLSTIEWMLSHHPQDRPTAEELKSTVLYKWASALRYRDLSDFFRDMIEDQKRQLVQKTQEVTALQSQLVSVHHDLTFLEEYINFQQDSDQAIRRSLRIIAQCSNVSTSKTPAPSTQPDAAGSSNPAALKPTPKLPST